VNALVEHAGNGLFDLVVSNQECKGDLSGGIQWVETEDDLELDFPVYRTNLVDSTHSWRHDSVKLANVLMDLLQERTGPLVE
jgi:hypothetical protein